MRRMRPPLSRFPAALVFAAAAAAQTTWTVTTSGGVQAAIQAAAPGDVILLPNIGGMPDYNPFVVNKGVTIRGAVGGCHIGWPQGIAVGPLHEIAVNVPAGQRAHLDNLDLTYSFDATLQANVGTQLVVNGGAVTVQRCTIVRGTGHGAVLTNAAVLFQSCSIVANGLNTTGLNMGGRGIEAQGSHVTVRDSMVRGSNRTTFWFGSHIFGWAAQAGIGIAGGSLHAERTSFNGGSGISAVFPTLSFAGACGIEVASGASVWISDGTLAGGSALAPSAGGTALCNGGGGTVYLANVTLLAGTPNGSAFTGSVNAAEPLVRLVLAPPLQIGAMSTMTCRGTANNVFVLGIALDQVPVFHPFAIQPLWCVTNVPIVAGLLDATGAGTFPVAVPAVPSLQHATFWCQAVSGSGLPLHASTIAGGMIL